MGIKDFFKRGAKADPAHVSVYEYLLDRGWTDAQIRAAASEGRGSTRSWQVAVVDQEHGDPIVGIVYTADYKYEEEAGGGTLQKAFGVKRFAMQMDPARRKDDLVRVFDLPEADVMAGEVALAVGVEGLDLPVWGETVKAKPRGANSMVAGYQKPLSYSASDYVDHWNSGLRWSSPDLPGQRKWTRLEDHKVVELKAMAEALGVEVGRGLGKGRVLKEDYLRALEAQRQSHVKEFPGWFQSGQVLILRATMNSEAGRIASDVLRALWFAYQAGTFGFGKGLSGPFSSGFSLLDVADVDGGTLEEQAEVGKWVVAQEKLLEPVAEELKARGHKWYFLGRPTLFTDEADGVVHYWLNGHSYPMDVGGNSQPFGYYTLAELLDEKFVRDLEEKNSGRVTGKPRY